MNDSLFLISLVISSALFVLKSGPPVWIIRKCMSAVWVVILGYQRSQKYALLIPSHRKCNIYFLDVSFLSLRMNGESFGRHLVNMIR